jgi:heptosyltransferase-1
LREHRYDLVLDLQGLFESALIASWARGRAPGFSLACVRERLAALTYDRRYSVDMSRHAIERLRELAARALGHSADGLPVFGLIPPGPRLEGLPAQPYAVLLHATSRPENAGQGRIGRRWCGDWPNRASTACRPGAARRSRRRRRTSPHRRRRVTVDRARGCCPGLSLAQCAVLLRDARRVIGVDTGLTHLACALERPTVALFGATPAWRYGPYWTPKAVGLDAPEGRWPSPGEVMEVADALEQAWTDPPHSRWRSTPGRLACASAGGRPPPVARARTAMAICDTGMSAGLGSRAPRQRTPADPTPLIWIHAVSVGETRAAQPLVSAIRARLPGARILITAMTPTGRETARALFGDTVLQAYLPSTIPERCAGSSAIGDPRWA